MAGPTVFTITGIAEFRDILRKLRGLGPEAELAAKEVDRALSKADRNAFKEVVGRARAAAREVGLIFSQTDLTFRTKKGELVPPETLQALGRLKASFREAQAGLDQFAAGSARIQQGLRATAAAAEQASQAAARSGSGLAEFAAGSSILEGAVGGLAFALSNSLLDAFAQVRFALGGMVQDFAALDTELRLAAAAGGEEGGYERLARIVDQVGIEAAGTTLEVAQMATSLSRAGFSVQEISEVLPGVVRGAEATGTAFQNMADIVGATLRGFALDVRETDRVIDVLVNTANASNASIEGLGETFKIAAPVAKALNIDIEELAAATGLLANAGIQGSLAGTGLRTGLERLQKAAQGASGASLGLGRGSEQLAGALKALGTQVTQANGELLPLDQVLLRLKTSLGALDTGARVELASALFGDEAGSKFLSIVNQSESEIRKMFGTIRDSRGVTDKTREAMQGFQLTLQQLEGTAQSLTTTMGGVVAAAFLPFVQAANLALGAVSALPAPVKALGAALIGLAAAYATARAAQAVFQSAIRTEIVGTAIAEVGQFATLLRARLAADAAGAAAALQGLGRAVASGALGQGLAQASTSVLALGTALRSLSAQQTLAAVSGVFAGLGRTAQSGIGAAVQAVGALGPALAGALSGSGQALGGLAVQFRQAALESRALEKSSTGLAAVLQQGVTAGATVAANATGGLGRALLTAGASAGAAALTLGAVAVAIAGVVAALASYQAAFSEANKANEEFNATLQKYRQSLKEVGVETSNLANQQGPVEGFFTALSRGTGELVSSLGRLPVVGGLASAALETLRRTAETTPVGLLARAFGAAGASARGLAKDVRAAYAEVSNQNQIIGAAEVVNKIATEGENAGASVGQLRKQFAALNGQPVSEAQNAALSQTVALLDANINAGEQLAKTLGKQAQAARDAGNNGLADELEKQKKAIESSNALSEKRRQLLLKDAEAAGAAAQGDRLRTQSLQALNEQLAKQQGSNALKNLEAEAAALQQVAKGNLTAGQAARQKEALTRSALVSEIDLIDKALAGRDQTKDKDEELNALLRDRASKVRDLAQIDADAAIRAREAVAARIEAERELNNIILQAPVRALDSQLAVGQGLLQFAQAAAGLEQARFDTVRARNQFEIDNAQQLGLTQEQIAQRQQSNDEIKRQALIAQYRTLLQTQAVEGAILALSQRKATVEAQIGVIQAQQAAVRAQQAVLDAQASGDATRIGQAQAALALSQENVRLAGERLTLLTRTQPLEAAAAQAAAETAREQLRTQGASLGIEQALLRIAPAQQVNNTAFQKTQELIASLPQTLGTVGGSVEQVGQNAGTVVEAFKDASGAITALSKTASDAGSNAEQLGDRVGEAKENAEGLQSTGIDQVVNRAAGAAKTFADNMRNAATSAQQLLQYLSSAAGLSPARFTGGPVEAGRQYRINDGPGGRSLGREAFLSAAGRLSLINAPANSLWTAPTSGMVIPAAMTRQLTDAGLVGPHASVVASHHAVAMQGRRQRATASPGRAPIVRRGPDPTMARLELAVTNLAGQVKALTQKEWTVPVHVRNSAGMTQLRVLNGLV